MKGGVQVFSSMTSTATVAVASDFAEVLATPAMLVAGLAVAIGLTGWVVSRLRRAAR